ncbi:hypothetical protein CLV63_102283 [Murinocardiopsis flavida]|uniref:Uncharacterized protein n=1 Tax=Murinocardiopsis flavida TaxID=645275 RepID=A0A2P8DSF8_9ACTN|nr:hypothetical protein CLV63_102283 [Murinocardiopsis flavida]
MVRAYCPPERTAGMVRAHGPPTRSLGTARRPGSAGPLRRTTGTGRFARRRRSLFSMRPPGQPEDMSALAIILLIVGIILIVAGVMALLRKQMLWGIVLIVVGVIITPGGMIFG